MSRLGSAVVALAVAAGLSQTASGDDWIGDRYGWRANDNRLQATTDGGRHWKTIFFGTGDFWRFAHTGPTSGVVAIGAPGGDEVNWTLDNGRHWYSTDAVGLHNDIEGRGHRLYWARGAGLYQVTPWPPGPAQLECRRLVSGNGTLLCVKPKHPLRSRRVASVPRGDIYQLAIAPGGVVGLVRRGRWSDDPALPLFRFLIHRNGANRVISLPPLPPESKGRVDEIENNLFVSWPFVTVVGYGFSDKSNAIVVAVWASRDGGESWTVMPGSG